MAFNKIKKGKILVEIKILNTEKLLNLFWTKNIRVYKVKKRDFATLILEIDYLNYAEVKTLVESLGGRINIIKSNGFVFFLGGIKKRMSLAIGSVLFLGIIFYLSTYIWSIEVEVQKNIPPFEIRKELSEIGIKPGISKDSIDVKEIEKKLENKKKLQEILGLEVNPDIPLVGIVSRLTSQKGLDLINYMMPEIMSENLQMVVLGTGEHQYQSMFNYYNSNFSDKLSARITFDTAFAQQIYAACDIFLMPSLYEPCGIGQMLAMRYGSIPIVRETGGLKDTVMPYNKFTGEGNGFSFANYNAHEMFFTLQKAIKLYQDKNIWNNLIINAMNTDNSWKKSAQDYIRIFKSLIS